MTLELMITVKIDDENAAEEFWHWVQFNEMPSEWQQIFDRLVDEPVTVSPSVGTRFKACVAGIPGWADGPSYAREALIIDGGDYLQIKEQETNE